MFGFRLETILADATPALKMTLNLKVFKRGLKIILNRGSMDPCGGFGEGLGVRIDHKFMYPYTLLLGEVGVPNNIFVVYGFFGIHEAKKVKSLFIEYKGSRKKCKIIY